MNLGSVKTITRIQLWGRTDCCETRLDGFQILTSFVPNVATALAAGPCFNPYSTVTDPPAVIDLTQTPHCMSAQYVWVYLPGPSQLLSLIEVQVLTPLPFVWRKLSGLAEVATGKPAVQSSTLLAYSGGDASRAVDGDTSQNNYNFGSCTHTQNDEVDPNAYGWWRVDLGMPYDVSTITIWPRTDCCQSRNMGFNVAAGLSTDTAFDQVIPYSTTACGGGTLAGSFCAAGIPTNIGPTAASPWMVSFPFLTPVRARYVTIWRTFQNDGTNNGDANILALCEGAWACVRERACVYLHITFVYIYICGRRGVCVLAYG